MSTRNQQEPAGQEHPTPVTPAEAEPPAPEQQASMEETLPTDFSASSASPPDPADIEALLLEWVRTPDWPTSHGFLQAHPELLTEAAEQLLETPIQLQTDERAQELLTLHQQLLQATRQQRVEAAYEPLLQHEEEPDSSTTAEEELQAQVIAWLQTPDWAPPQIYLQTHPHLLTDAAKLVLEALKHAQKDEHARTWNRPRQTTGPCKEQKIIEVGKVLQVWFPLLLNDGVAAQMKIAVASVDVGPGAGDTAFGFCDRVAY